MTLQLCMWSYPTSHYAFFLVCRFAQSCPYRYPAPIMRETSETISANLFRTEKVSNRQIEGELRGSGGEVAAIKLPSAEHQWL